MKDINTTTDNDTWDEEVIFLSGDDYYSSVLEDISTAKSSIAFECYLFANDEIGIKFKDSLIDAKKRGLNVRIIVDGIGSEGWIKNFGEAFKKENIPFKVFHQVPWERFLYSSKKRVATLSQLFKLLRKINRRNHRKVIIIDEKIAYVGSRNITVKHSELISKEKAWKDISLKIKGRGIKDLLFSFDWIWMGRAQRLRHPIESRRKLFRNFFPLLRLNLTKSMRRSNHRKLYELIRTANNKVWIASGYFNPSRSVVKSLKKAAFRGVDVRIITPAISDVFFIPWIANAYYQELFSAGINIYEYLPTILHTKAMIIDDIGIIGSTNLNHRSLLHDLEVDVIVNKASSISTLTNTFCEYMKNSVEITSTHWSDRPIWQRILGKFGLLFRNWF